ncbi:hypothetical protein PMAYCL1PPCAC_22505 [Pristionchus mayeri]|uniref:Uncharacterized protein n=1 Tax=Pristionchus mayeri TaxID=1317129 RepID=A0AAN5CX84_9BILA|nr:hypothetical protein PMAYCL1PPCAC_22505 [Pristionchus mayeri]
MKGTSFCHFLGPLLPLVFRLIDKCAKKKWALRLFSSLIIEGPDLALHYQPSIVPLLISSLSDVNPDARLRCHGREHSSRVEATRHQLPRVAGGND